ncbi:MAG: Cache 3/Cache 2 fusion domain-containing protein [Bacteroidales bacterium]|nr:Cache 3/Cache 2 fusion domain-containing protein [Bacteroidales bacterium]
MLKKHRDLQLRLRLFFPVVAIIIIVLSMATFFNTQYALRVVKDQVDQSLVIQVNTIAGMFERERILQLEKVQTNLDVARWMFYSLPFYVTDQPILLTAIHQNSLATFDTHINEWKRNNKSLYHDTAFVDQVKQLVGGTVTIFQRIDSGFIRIATNVTDNKGDRAVNTYIDNQSPVVKAVLQGNTYYGRAFVVNDWYITAYEPIIHNEKVVGMLYVGDKEKDILEVKKILNNLMIGKTGYPFVIGYDGTMLIHPYAEGTSWQDSAVFHTMLSQQSGVMVYRLNDKNRRAAFLHYPDFKIIIGASVDEKAEIRQVVRQTISNALFIAVGAVLVLSLLIYFVTTDKLYHYLKKVEQSRKRLSTAHQALKQSEERFEKLFDSTGDAIFVTDANENIIEVNQAACDILGYSKEQMLSMKMSEIKTPDYAAIVAENRRKIYKKGSLTFESVHVTHDGVLVPVEITSRVVEYKDEKLILSVARNISERKKVEREVLSAVIRAEERERERFAKDMHDGLGPLLSTIKLYVDELENMQMDESERSEMIKYTDELIDEAMQSIRSISNNLTPRVIHEFGLHKAIEAFCDKINKTNAVKIIYAHQKAPNRFDINFELILFRVISELINNTLKHAKASNISIELFESDGKIILRFTDDGVGFDLYQVMERENKGIGLRNIISRIKSVNGVYNIDSAPGEGLRVEVEFER